MVMMSLSKLYELLMSLRLFCHSFPCISCKLQGLFLHLTTQSSDVKLCLPKLEVRSVTQNTTYVNLGTLWPLAIWVFKKKELKVADDQLEFPP